MLPLSPSPFLKHLSTLFPATSPLQNPYHYIAGIVYAANNLPQDAAATYQHALLTLPQSATSITRIFREALFKTGVLYGAPRMINALLEAGKWIPDGVPSDEEGYR